MILSPEAQIWMAVLRQAIYDLGRKSYVGSARRWMDSRTTTPGSFLWICANLDIDENALKHAVMSRAGRERLLGHGESIAA